MMKKLGEDLNENEIEHMFNEFQSDEINFQQFKMLASNK